MGTERRMQPCSLCGETPDIACDEKIVEELVVLDYRVKTAHFSGCPSPETHTVHGWKIKHNRSLHTYICEKCAVEKFDQIKKTAPRKAVIAAGFAVFLLGLIIVLFRDNSGGRHDWILMGLLFIVSPVTLLVCISFMVQAFSKKDFSYGVLHSEALYKLISVKSNFCSLDYPKMKGATFYLKAEEWAEAAQIIAQVEAKTGWSSFQYIRDTFHSKIPTTIEEGAGFLKVEHIGLFLEKE